MNLSQLEVLIALADTGNMTEAGAVVGLTQSAVSYALRNLEAELGVTLFERGRQGVVVTRIGQEVVAHARTILTQIALVRQKTARARGLSAAKLRFGAVTKVPLRLITGVLRDFNSRYPEVEVVTFEGTIEEVIDWLEHDIVDVATTVNPARYPAVVPLGAVEVKALVSARHPLAAQSEVTLESLVHESLIGSRAEYVAFAQLPALQQVLGRNVRHEVSTLSATLAMVRENMGVALLHDKIIDPSVEGIVSLSFQPRLWLRVYVATRTITPVTDVFLQTASAWIKEHGIFGDMEETVVG